MMSKASVSAGVYKYRTEKLRIQDFVTALFFAACYHIVRKHLIMQMG